MLHALYVHICYIKICYVFSFYWKYNIWYYIHGKFSATFLHIIFFTSIMQRSNQCLICGDVCCFLFKKLTKQKLSKIMRDALIFFLIKNDVNFFSTTNSEVIEKRETWKNKYFRAGWRNAFLRFLRRFFLAEILLFYF